MTPHVEEEEGQEEEEKEVSSNQNHCCWDIHSISGRKAAAVCAWCCTSAWEGQAGLPPQSGTLRVSQDNHSVVCVGFPGLK